MRIGAVVPLALATNLLGPPAAEAQMGPSILHSQTRAIERTVQRNIVQLVRPKPVVTEGTTGAATTVALSADERTLVTAVGNDTVHQVWDL